METDPKRGNKLQSTNNITSYGNGNKPQSTNNITSYGNRSKKRK